jgi:hypothetical protein
MNKQRKITLQRLVGGCYRIAKLTNTATCSYPGCDQFWRVGDIIDDKHADGMADAPNYETETVDCKED